MAGISLECSGPGPSSSVAGHICASPSSTAWKKAWWKECNKYRARDFDSLDLPWAIIEGATVLHSQRDCHCWLQIECTLQWVLYSVKMMCNFVCASFLINLLQKSNNSYKGKVIKRFEAASLFINLWRIGVDITVLISYTCCWVRRHFNLLLAWVSVIPADKLLWSLGMAHEWVLNACLWRSLKPKVRGAWNGHSTWQMVWWDCVS